MKKICQKNKPYDFSVSSFEKMLCLHQQENKYIFTPRCNGSQVVAYQTKNTAMKIKKQIIWPIIKDDLSYDKQPQSNWNPVTIIFKSSLM